jgi:hypothetical protein
MARSETKYYCPKCERKTLVRDREWSSEAGQWLGTWVCKNTPSKAIARLKQAIDDGEATGTVEDYSGYYESYEAKYGDDEEKTAARKKEYDRVIDYYAKNPPCGITIKVHNRDAKIVDYFSVLDLLIRDGTAVMHHLLEANPNFYRKGFESLYSSETVDVVRMRDDRGVAVWLYWKCCWEPEREKSEINWSALTSGAAAYIHYGEVPVPQIFHHSYRLCLWSKELRNKPLFTDEKLTKSVKEKIVQWVKGLEQALPQLTEQAAAGQLAWNNWFTETQNATQARCGHRVVINQYDGEVKEVRVGINGWITPEQLQAIAEILADGRGND